MKQAQSKRQWLQALERLAKGLERQAREDEIATCECGAQVRHNGTEWIHVGECK